MRPVLSAAKQVTEQREMKEDKWPSLLLSDLYFALDNCVKVAIRLQKKIT
jgi:hypothetical protein